MKDEIVRSSMWRWYCGGSVIGIAVVLGCATAVDLSPRSPANKIEKPRRGVAAEAGKEPAHNGGKSRMPVSASFDGDSIISITKDTDVNITIVAEADLANVRGSIDGIDGLDGDVQVPFSFPKLSGGEARILKVRLPAQSGSLIVSVSAEVIGDGSGQTMSTALELKVLNPKQVQTKALSNSPND